jgi:transposase InsO family protein
VVSHAEQVGHEIESYLLDAGPFRNQHIAEARKKSIKTVFNFSRLSSDRARSGLRVLRSHRHRFETLQHASPVLGDWISFYNHRRPHQALGMRTPAAIFALAA